ncbi:DmsE family decaheme c-type cytochrome [Motiliproteus sediminis]|uniref:DmsE family decaheme c-type cytochrome n=1 Tax=Motiliproteus sediminis TaxID=1468178 RepID=UPI001AEFEDD4|nr:DmsE family decaheme c-type cytochrome [Motiliproteus sediminis]
MKTLRVRRSWLSGSLLALLCLSTLPAVSFAAEDERGDLVLKEDAKCTRCHDEYELYPVLSIGKTKHGTMADGRTPSCTSCHGDSQAHIDGSETESERPLVDVQFGAKSPTPVADRNATCQSCHKGGERMHWGTSTHNANDVACTSCHQVHTEHDKVRVRQDQAEVCFNCHKQQRMDINKFSRHPVEEGKVVCSDCHNAHGSAGPKNMVRDSVVETCYQCHAEKRGPFIWDHMPVTEDCGNCHNPHGSNIAGMLKARQPMLCQQCHEGTSHRGHVPEVDGRYTAGRGCLNCHTNIHGSNNPTANRESRSMRR